MTITASDGPAAPPAGPSGAVPVVPEPVLRAVPEQLAHGAAITDVVDVEAVVAAVRRSRPDVPVDVIRAAVDRSVWSFRGARIAHYLPVLIERQVRLHLRLEAG